MKRFWFTHRRKRHLETDLHLLTEQANSIDRKLNNITQVLLDVLRNQQERIKELTLENESLRTKKEQ